MKPVNDLSQYSYEECTKRLGFHETYYIICTSWDVRFREKLEYMFGNTDINEKS